MSTPGRSAPPLAPSEVGLDILSALYGSPTTSKGGSPPPLPDSEWVASGVESPLDARRLDLGRSIYKPSPASSQRPPTLASLMMVGEGGGVSLTLPFPQGLSLRGAPKEPLPLASVEGEEGGERRKAGGLPPQCCSLFTALFFVAALTLALGLGLGLGLRPSSPGVSGPPTPSSVPSASSKMANVSSFTNVTTYTTILATVFKQSTAVSLKMSVSTLTTPLHQGLRCDISSCLSALGVALEDVHVSSSTTLDSFTRNVSITEEGNTASTCPSPGSSRALAAAAHSSTSTSSLLHHPNLRQLDAATNTTPNATNSTEAVCPGSATTNPLSGVSITLDNLASNASVILALLANFSFPSTLAAIAANASCLIPIGGNLSSVLGLGEGAFAITNVSYITTVNVTVPKTTLVESVQYLDVTTAAPTPSGTAAVGTASGAPPTASSRPTPTMTRPVDGTTTPTLTSTRTSTKTSNPTRPPIRTKVSTPTNLGAGYAAAQGAMQGEDGVAPAPPPPGTATGSISTSASTSGSASASPSPSSSASTSASSGPMDTSSPSPSPSTSPSASPSPSVSPSASASPSASPSASASPAPSAAAGGRGELTFTPEPTMSDWWGTESPGITGAPSPTTALHATGSPTSGVSLSASHCPSTSPSSLPTHSGTPTASGSLSPSITPSPSASASATSSASPTPTPTSTLSVTQTNSWTVTTSPSPGGSVASFPATPSGGVSGSGSVSQGWSVSHTPSGSPPLGGTGSRATTNVGGGGGGGGGSGTGSGSGAMSGSLPPTPTISPTHSLSLTTTQSNGAPTVTPTYATPLSTFTPSQCPTSSVSQCGSGTVSESPPATVTVGSPSSTVSVATGSGSPSAPLSPSAASPSPTPSVATLSPTVSLSLSTSGTLTPTLSSTLCPSTSSTSTGSSTPSPCHSPSPTYLVPTTTLSATLCLTSTQSHTVCASATPTTTSTASATASATATAWNRLACDAVACYLGLSGSYDSDGAMSACSALTPPASGAAWNSASITDDATFASVVSSFKCGGSFAATTVYWTGLTYTGGVFAPFSSYEWKSGADTTYFSSLSVNKNFGKRLKVDGELQSANDGDTYAACCQYYLVASVTSTKTATLSPTLSPSGSGLASPSLSPSTLPTACATATVSPSPSLSFSSTPSSSPSATLTSSVTSSSTRSPAGSRTHTPSATSTTTASASPTVTHSKPGTPSLRVGGTLTASAPPIPTPSSIPTLSSTAIASATATVDVNDPCPNPGQCTCGLWAAAVKKRGNTDRPRLEQLSYHSCPQSSVHKCCSLSWVNPPINVAVAFYSYSDSGRCGSGAEYCTTTTIPVNPPVRGLETVVWPNQGCQPGLGFCDGPKPPPTAQPNPSSQATVTDSGSPAMTPSSTSSPVSSPTPMGSGGSSTGSAFPTPSPPGGGTPTVSSTPLFPSSSSRGSLGGTGSATGSGTSTASATASATATIPPPYAPPPFPALGGNTVVTLAAFGALMQKLSSPALPPTLTAVASVPDGSGFVFALVGNSLVVGDSKGGGYQALCGHPGREGAADGPCANTNGHFNTPTVVTWGSGTMAVYAKSPCILYIGDTGNHALRVASVTNLLGYYMAVLSTLTGFPSAGDQGGFLDGPCVSALFLTPTGIALVPTSSSSSTVASPLVSPLKRSLLTNCPNNAKYCSDETQPTKPTQLLVCDGDNGAVRLVTFYGPSTAPTQCLVESYAGYVADQPGGGGNNLGTGGSKFVNGPLLDSRFNAPAGIVMVGTTAYLIDQGNGVVRAIDTGAHRVSTLVELGKSTTTTTTTTTDSEDVSPPFFIPTYPFTNPQGLALTPSGALMVAVGGEHWVVAVAQGFPPQAFAGTQGTAGWRDGPKALFSGPSGVACDESGNLVVADGGNGALRYIPYLAPSPPPTKTPRPTPLSARTASRSSSGTRTRSTTISPSRSSTRSAKPSIPTPSPKPSKPSEAATASPDPPSPWDVQTLVTKVAIYGLAIDSSGVLYAGEGGGQKVLKIAPGGIMSTHIALTGGSYAVPGASFVPFGLAVDSRGVLFITDAKTNCIWRLSDGVVTVFAGSGAASASNGVGKSASFQGPSGVAVSSTSGMVYVADSGNHLIRMITPTGTVTTLAGRAGTTAVSLQTGKTTFSDGAPDTATFWAPSGLAVSSLGFVYVADSGNHRIRLITPAGFTTTLAGTGAIQPFSEGLSATFSSPSGIALGSLGVVYVADKNNNRIRQITPTGKVSTFAGTGNPGAKNGNAKSAFFNQPYGIAVDGDGVLYVADTSSRLIRTITKQG